MSIAEKLVTVSENASRAVELNRDLETILAGGNTGGKSEMDEFWDLYQSNGTRLDHLGAFCGTGWRNENFKPKYDIKPGTAYMMFRGALISGDLVDTLSKLGVSLDFSGCTDVRFAFMSSQITRLGVIDLSSATLTESMFNGARQLRTIDKLILKADGSQTFSSFFNNTSELENITIEGTIGNNIDFSACTKLTHDSLMSIINHLQDKTGAATKPVLTIGTTNYKQLTEEERKIATDKNWEVV